MSYVRYPGGRENCPCYLEKPESVRLREERKREEREQGVSKKPTDPVKVEQTINVNDSALPDRPFHWMVARAQANKPDVA
jgi:hypothetical protein